MSIVWQACSMTITDEQLVATWFLHLALINYSFLFLKLPYPIRVPILRCEHSTRPPSRSKSVRGRFRSISSSWRSFLSLSLPHSRISISIWLVRRAFSVSIDYLTKRWTDWMSSGAMIVKWKSNPIRKIRGKDSHACNDDRRPSSSRIKLA